MKIPRWLRVFGLVVAAVLLLSVVSVGSIWVYFHPSYQRTSAVVYGQRHGRELTLDVVRPSKPNGLGVALMVSGAWKSSANDDLYEALAAEADA